MKKNLKIAFLAVIFVVGFAHQASAAGYVPLVQIPGVPEGEVDMSAYLVGMYNFLLSIVGIVAVVMLIIGGMKYIMAAGNSATVSDAKDTIWSAIFGLILALLSWVFVSTINPDVLYLKQPGSAFSTTSTVDYGTCGTFDDSADPNCICDDGETIRVSDEYFCEQECINGYHCDDDATDQSCLSSGSATNWYDGEKCICGDETEYSLSDAGGDCNTYCKEEGHCGGKFIVVKMHARHGYNEDYDNLYVLSADEGDELWDFFITDDGTYGPFDIDKNVEYIEGTVEDADGDTIDVKYTCAILITNEDSGGGLDESYVFWVIENTTVGQPGRSLYDEISHRSYPCCDTYGCEIGWGECAYDVALGETTGGAERVLKAIYSSDISDDCGSCTLSDNTPASYEFARTKTCKNGVWR